MTTREQELSKYLAGIAEALDISDTMRDKAITGYQAVGKWLAGSEKTADVVIMPQGSFALGTVIKPVDDRDEYDIDLVCLMKDKPGFDEKTIKTIVGNRLKEHGTYKNMLDPEGKRCWTLNYEEFHMDVLPCVPNNSLYMEPYLTEIRLTHKEADGSYTPRYSNPYAYHQWFEGRMATVLKEARSVYASNKNVKIEKVPLYAVKTPLQRAIQLLKRHRDIMYSAVPASKKDDAPISIIITTLAALAYNNEATVYEALNGIVSAMESGITVKDGRYWVANPVMKDENFAEKWNEAPTKRTEFGRWLKQAKADLVTHPSTILGLNNIAESYMNSLGENITKKTFSAIADAVKTSREAGALFVAGATKHLTTQTGAGGPQVKEHTFFGK
jgi:predicted SAM-dependent methyltransferase